MRSFTTACISREFTCLAAGKESPVANWLRALARDLHGECGGPGVGAIGMCLTGGFALALIVDDTIAAPVLSQPSLPLPFRKKNRPDVGLSEQSWQRVKARVGAGCPVLGLRFTEDRLVPDARFETLSRDLGDGFLAIEIDSSSGNPFGFSKRAHSVLTEELVDETDNPTFQALNQVLDFFDERLR